MNYESRSTSSTDNFYIIFFVVDFFQCCRLLDTKPSDTTKHQLSKDWRFFFVCVLPVMSCWSESFPVGYLLSLVVYSLHPPKNLISEQNFC